MKRCGYGCVLLLAAAVGCIGLPKSFVTPKTAKSEAAEPVTRPKRPAAITADQVREDNAHQMSQALMSELEREANGDGER
jgi:hypothetical protein